MEIIFINREKEIIKIGENVKIEVLGVYLVGINMEQKIMEIEGYESEEKAKEKLKEITRRIKKWIRGERSRSMVIDLSEEGEEEK